MPTYNPSALTEKETNILIILFCYRGMRAKDLVVFLIGTARYSYSEERSVYNYLAKLKKKSLVKSVRLQGVNTLGSLYYLTTTGLETIKSILNIKTGIDGDGILPFSEDTLFWDIPIEYQNPPFKQTEHFLLLIEFFKQLVADKENIIQHQTTLYSNLVSYAERSEQKLRPDAMLKINGHNYAVEIDRATESHEQLLQKFVRYKDYYDALEEEQNLWTSIHTILFIVEERTRKHGIQRRWRNVLSAFYKAFGNEFPKINLVMIPMNEVAETLYFEVKRVGNLQHYRKVAANYFEKNGFELVEDLEDCALYQKGNELRGGYVHIHYEFESKAYENEYILQQFEKKMKTNPRKKSEGVIFNGLQGYRFSLLNNSSPVESIQSLNVEPAFLTQLEGAAKTFNKYKIIPDHK